MKLASSAALLLVIALTACDDAGQPQSDSASANAATSAALGSAEPAVSGSGPHDTGGNTAAASVSDDGQTANSAMDTVIADTGARPSPPPPPPVNPPNPQTPPPRPR